jgi:dolichol-phosphate mannosyltransferase
MSASLSPADLSNPVEISVLVPVMNEAGNIVPLIDEICDVFEGRQFEIIYIDDASTDSTGTELSALLKKVPQLRVLRHAKRSGQSAAIWSGLRQARGVLIGVLDGDGQNVPADFTALETALLNQGDSPAMAAGIRQRRNDSYSRLLASHVAKWIRAGLLSDSHPDSGCGIKVLPRSLFLELPFFNHMHRFMPSLVRRHGGVVIGVPVEHRPRQVGVSKYRLLDRLIVGISDVFGVIWLLRRAPATGFVTELYQPARPAKKKSQPASSKKGPCK